MEGSSCTLTWQFLLALRIFLGFFLDSGIQFGISLPLLQEKLKKPANRSKDLLATVNPKIIRASEIIGILISNLPAVDYGALHCRFVEKIEKSRELMLSLGNYNHPMPILR